MITSLKTNLINEEFLHTFSKEILEKKFDPKQLEVLEFIVSLQDDLKIFSNKGLLDFQNTNLENYAYIIKELINDVNNTSSIIIENLKFYIRNFEEFLPSKLYLVGHEISYNSNLEVFESLTMKDIYSSYMNELNTNALIIYEYLESIGNMELRDTFAKKVLFASNITVNEFDNDEEDYVYRKLDCHLKEDGTLLKINRDNIDTLKDKFGRHEDIGINLYKDFEKVFNSSRTPVHVKEALDYFMLTPNNEKVKDFYIHSFYFSLNLIDEKLLEKKSHLHTFFCDNEKFNIICKDMLTIKKLKNGISKEWLYTYKLNFSIEFYLKSKLIEIYTKKEFFEFMCIAKDFLSNFVYLEDPNREQNYNQTHPAVIQSNLVFEIEKTMGVFKNRYDFYLTKIKDEAKKSDNLFHTQKLDYWIEHLEIPQKIQSDFRNSFTNIEPSENEVLAAINKLVSSSIYRYFVSFVKDSEKNSVLEEYQKNHNYLNEAITSIFTRLYEYDECEKTDSNFDKSKFFKLRNKATIHSTLKESYVIDLRSAKDENSTSSILLNDNVKKALEKNDNINKLIDVLKTHKYHDYIEIDKDFFKTNSLFSLEQLIEYLQLINKFNIPTPSKCALKLRKLGNHKAKGIYSTHSKLLGIDFRMGIESYMHEMAHHIDLNGFFSYRKKLCSILYGYFEPIIRHRKEYYLKNEELIARAGEISLLLLLGRYKTYKEKYLANEIDAQVFIELIKKTFHKTNYSKFMGSWDYYKEDHYINIEKSIHTKNFYLLDLLVSYFTSFWSGKNISNEDINLISSSNVSSSNENLFAKKNHHSYNYYYKDLYNIDIKPVNNRALNELYLEKIIKEGVN